MRRTNLIVRPGNACTLSPLQTAAVPSTPGPSQEQWHWTAPSGMSHQIMPHTEGEWAYLFLQVETGPLDRKAIASRRCNFIVRRPMAAKHLTDSQSRVLTNAVVWHERAFRHSEGLLGGSSDDTTQARMELRDWAVSQAPLAAQGSVWIIVGNPPDTFKEFKPDQLAWATFDEAKETLFRAPSTVPLRTLIPKTASTSGGSSQPVTGAPSELIRPPLPSSGNTSGTPPSQDSFRVDGLPTNDEFLRNDFRFYHYP